MRFLFLASLLLVACVPATPQQIVQREEPAINPEQRQEEVAPIAIEALIAGTGALTERLLPTGVIDIGNREAPLTILLFTEHHAQYSREFHMDLFPRLLEDFIEPGLVRFQIVILPLKKYPQSENAAAALLCAAMQNKGMAIHAMMTENIDKERLDPRFYAEDLELDLEAFDECTEGEDIALILKQQKAWAQSLDVTLVPTYFVNGEKNVGLPYYADLRGMLEKLGSRM